MDSYKRFTTPEKQVLAEKIDSGFEKIKEQFNREAGKFIRVPGSVVKMQTRNFNYLIDQSKGQIKLFLGEMIRSKDPIADNLISKMHGIIERASDSESQFLYFTTKVYKEIEGAVLEVIKEMYSIGGQVRK
ncbi:MAG: hypothetical protein LVQ97_01810 [Candidatus Micrarchaeales archaeon]|uniref:Uncharacterized protein n=1 Tax=Candidatus Micrarchaeum acidiphilum ARMAN-2 TaxID=425595 RepID=C7DI78_MICA2|nr:MAG: hypothetical protein UNLARM2_0770 [Candidatus Micrarchaeum acidiphilum ARMAN-2]MCW6160902.1 hypothetical protein [Candidatus Micrarchaeales archaeon]